MTYLLIGAVVWAYLGILFGFLDGDRRLGALGGDDRVHVHGAALACHAPAAARACSRSSTGSSARVFLFGVCALFFSLSMPDANFLAALVILAHRVDLVHRDRDR